MENQDDSENSPLENLSDTVGDLVTGVPSPIRKNLFKAFGRLCTKKTGDRKNQ